jgi:hypothetical protein
MAQRRSTLQEKSVRLQLANNKPVHGNKAWDSPGFFIVFIIFLACARDLLFLIKARSASFAYVLFACPKRTEKDPNG